MYSHNGQQVEFNFVYPLNFQTNKEVLVVASNSVNFYPPDAVYISASSESRHVKFDTFSRRVIFWWVSLPKSSGIDGKQRRWSLWNELENYSKDRDQYSKWRNKIIHTKNSLFMEFLTWLRTEENWRKWKEMRKKGFHFYWNIKTSRGSLNNRGKAIAIL